jgi:predicted RecB family endonuclease
VEQQETAKGQISVTAKRDGRTVTIAVTAGVVAVLQVHAALLTALRAAQAFPDYVA